MKLAPISLGVVMGIIIGFSTNSLANNFTDVNTSDWFYDYVQKIQEWGIISGNDDGTFAPGRDVVRAELGKMFVLFDERTDSKIEANNLDTQLMLNESLKAIEETSIIEPLPSTLVIRKRNNPPNLCPLNWTEVDNGYRGNDDLRINRRTCLTNQRCEVLTLTHASNNAPKACPENWEEASYGLVEGQDMERVCYICAQ